MLSGEIALRNKPSLLLHEHELHIQTQGIELYPLKTISSVIGSLALSVVAQFNCNFCLFLTIGLTFRTLVTQLMLLTWISIKHFIQFPTYAFYQNYIPIGFVFHF